jgi:hypothetical protein
MPFNKIGFGETEAINFSLPTLALLRSGSMGMFSDLLRKTPHEKLLIKYLNNRAMYLKKLQELTELDYRYLKFSKGLL